MKMMINRQILMLIGLGLLAFIIYIFTVVIPSQELEKEYKYTVGTVFKIENPSRGSKVANFSYRYKQRSYLSFFRIRLPRDKKVSEGFRIFIKFSPNDPENISLIHEKVVPDSLVAPDEGWEILPK